MNKATEWRIRAGFAKYRRSPTIAGMNATPDDATPEPSGARADCPKTDEEFAAWLLKDPGRHEALLEVLQETLEAKRHEMTAEQIAEVEQLSAQLRDELADFMLPEQHNQLVMSIRAMVEKESLTHEDVDELRAAAAALRKCIDTALDLKEPRRSAVIATLQDTEKKVNIMLAELKEMGLE